MDDVGDDDLNVSFGEDVLGVSSIFGESDLSVNASHDSSFDSIFSDVPPKSSTPKTNRNKRTESNHFKKPKAPPAKNLLRCPTCNRGLKTEKGLRNHILSHKWKEAAERLPNAQQLLDGCHLKSAKVIKDMMKDNIDLTSSPDSVPQPRKLFNDCLKEVSEKLTESSWHEFVTEVSEVVVKGLQKKPKVTFPSALREELQKSMASCMSSVDHRVRLLDKFKAIVSCSESVSWCFIFDFLKKLIDCMLIYVCELIQPKQNNSCVDVRSRSRDDHDHFMSHQVIHYVAGATMRSHIRHANQYPKNSRLNRMKECILSKFATIGSPPVLESKDKAYWTSLMNRKSLVFVNNNAFPFFLELSKLLNVSEQANGSLNHVAVMEAVTLKPNLISMWDSIVDNSLNEDESFSFLVKVVRSVTNTYGRGVLLRRMNLHSKTAKGNKGSLAVSHRARLL